MVCLAAKPIVDGLEQNLKGQAHVIRLSLNDSVGRRMASELNVYAVPTFIIFDSEGREVWRQGGFPNRDAILKAISGMH